MGIPLQNLKYMRQFYLAFPIGHELRDELSWTHYRILMRVADEKARIWYMNECVACGWGTRELEEVSRPEPLLFLRLQCVNQGTDFFNRQYQSGALHFPNRFYIPWTRQHGFAEARTVAVFMCGRNGRVL